MIKQSLQQKQQMKLTPQQIQLMNMLALHTMAFEERVREELEENPALNDEPVAETEEREETDLLADDYSEEEKEDRQDDYEMGLDGYLTDDDIPDYQYHGYGETGERNIPFSQGKTFTETLLEQMATLPLTAEQREIGRVLIGNIDDDGYLRRNLEAVSDDLAFSFNINTTPEQIEEVLRLIQQLDPPGVGARNLQESLLIQLSQRPERPGSALARQIIEECFEYLSKRNFDKIREKLGCNQEDLAAAFREIERLNPKPGSSLSSENGFTEQIVPDFVIRIHDGTIELSLNGKNAPELHINREYDQMLRTLRESKKMSRQQKDAALFVKQKIDSARWFVDAVRQRQQTMMTVMRAIATVQHQYLLTGEIQNLRPLNMKDIAATVNMDVSTISRVVSGKYVQTPYGTLPLRDFFSDGMTTETGEDVTTREIKDFLRITIEGEDKTKPLTDEELASVLNGKGYPVARRTVAKYREQLGIPVARLRRSF